jgi:hypothetical protein
MHGITADLRGKEETVLLAENEVIVGVVAKLYLDGEPLYTDF